MAKSKRIELLALLTKGSHTVLDIGTDHGLVLKEAFEKAYITDAIASDINEKPLFQAKKNLKDHPVTYVISDGFSQIKTPFDMVVIAGMGAFLITQILDLAPSDAHITYCLQANDKVEYLRKYLADHGFNIIDEHVLLDKFYYVILVVKRGIMTLTEEDRYLGPILKHKPESQAYYAQKAATIKKVLPKTDALRKKALEKIYKIYHNL
ncbi:MAG: tRNA (adenine(22)-N(1))-methyltransferase [Acholeplasmataceae bacterium]